MKNFKRSILFILLMTLAVWIVLKISWASFKEVSAEGYEIKTEEIYLENIASEWFNDYMQQYQKWSTPFSYKIKDVKIEYVEVLDKENQYIQIDYSFQPVSDNLSLLSNFAGSIEKDGKLTNQVVLHFEKTDNGYQVIEKMRPVNYQIKTDDSLLTDGLKEPEKAMLDKDMTYLIRNDKLYVTYNHGESFKEVPIDYQLVTYDPSTSYSSMSIQEGSYIIEEDYTGFLYIEDGNLKLIYSNDQGETWDTTTITDNERLYLRVRFLSKTENYFYVLYSTDKTMAAEGHQLSRSEDGIHFNEVEYQDPEMRVMTYAYFISDNVGYVAYTEHEAGEHRSFYRTEDGGKTFTQIDFELEEVIIQDYTYTPYIQVDCIYKENNQVHLIVGQGDNGDYGHYSAHYVSDDGIHFKFVEEIDTSVIEAG